MLRRTVALGGLCLSAVLVFARVVSAQAFVPPAGEGDVTTSYQNTWARGHLNSDGERINTDLVRAHSARWEIDFGLTDRLAVNASLPFVAARYGGTDPHPLGVRGDPSDLDDGTYHGAFQDFRFGTRFQLLARPIAITPFGDITVPSHHYESLGHSAVGLDLRALTAGVAAGGFVDAVLPGLYFETEVSHAIVEEVLGLRPNRTRVDAEIGYFVTPRFAIRFLESFLYTHDGLDYVGTEPTLAIHSGGVITRAHVLNHDRLQRANVLNLGGGIVVAVNESLSLMAAAATWVWGQSAHPHQAVTVGANWRFRTRGIAPSPSLHLTQRAGRFF
jgi:hypothetical protein